MGLRDEVDRAGLRDRAAALRAAGRSRADIEQVLGLDPDAVRALLRGVPVPDRLRHRAKDDVRAAAVALRQQGATYDEIANDLGVSKSSCSLWLRDVPVGVAVPKARGPWAEAPLVEEARHLRQQGYLLREVAAAVGRSIPTVWAWTVDLPVPARARPGRPAEEMRAEARRRWDRVLAEREAERQGVVSAARQRVGAMTAREVELVAAVAYWAEGSKSKPWARREHISFINSDPDLVLVFLAWLRDVGVGPERLALRVSIHESADVQAAQDWWAGLVGVPSESFMRPTLKRHRPTTVRKNTGDDYRGCLVVDVRGSRTLYQQVEGLWQGIVAAVLHGGRPTQQQSPVV